jgi:hypothetical protein
MEDQTLATVAFYLVVGWLFGMTILFVILLKKYTFGNWTPENPNPYVTETFSMPRGVFRGMLTMSLLFIVMLLEVVNLNFPIQTKEGQLLLVGDGLFLPEERYKELMVAFQMMLAFYFGSKVMHHITKADERKSVAESTALQQSAAPAPKEADESGAVG